MAVMYPDRIPDGYVTDPTRAAERRVYEALRDRLPGDFSVFAWVSWVRKAAGARAMDGEADFVVAHPNLGWLVLEVKGGGVSHDGVTGEWTSTDRYGAPHAMKRSPFVQARDGKYRILGKLSEHPCWRQRRIAMGHAVIFPDVWRPPANLGPDAPPEITLYHDDLAVLEEQIEAVFRYWRSKDGSGDSPGPEGVAVVRDTLARSFTLPMGMGVALESDVQETLRLTEPQFWVLDNLARNHRMVVSGRAGTGKTLLALEKARRLAMVDGCRTLLTCFNKLLAADLRKRVRMQSLLTVMSFHELCFDWARRAGIELPDPERPDLPTEFYRHELPGKFVDSVATIGDRFDAIVVDEGQDFGPDERAALELALDDRERSVLYVFQDEAQSVYRDGSPWPERGMASYVLSENIRSTKAIHGALGRLCGAAGTKTFGPAGSRPEFILARDRREQARELSRVLHRLIRDERIPPSSIVVLTSTRRNVPELAPGGRVGAFEITQDHEDRSRGVLIESVTRFKGLERDIVILVGLDPVEYCNYETLLYVGASRARAHLVVIAEADTLARFGPLTTAAGS